MKKLIIALILMAVGITALTFFALSANSVKHEAVPQTVQITAPQPRDVVALEPNSAPAPEVAPVTAPAVPKPWYESLADSIKELAAGLTALAGAIMAVVEVFKKLKEQKAPPAAT